MTDIEQQARKEAEEKYPLGADSGYAYMDKWARDHIKSLRVGYAAALITERSRPSLMVGFSEEDVRLIADGVAEDCGVDDETEDGAYTWKCMLECAMKVHEAHAANTRAVSIDKIMEAVKGWIKDDVGGSPIDDDEWKQDEWLKAEADLRQRLEKLTQQQVQ